MYQMNQQHAVYQMEQQRDQAAIDKVKRLIAEGDPSVNDNQAIQWTSSWGYTEVVQLLLQDRRVDPSAGNNSSIQWASRYGYTGIVRLLLQDRRVDPSDGNNWSIRGASQKGHLEVVELL